MEWTRLNRLPEEPLPKAVEQQRRDLNARIGEIIEERADIDADEQQFLAGHVAGDLLQADTIRERKFALLEREAGIRRDLGTFFPALKKAREGEVDKRREAVEDAMRQAADGLEEKGWSRPGGPDKDALPSGILYRHPAVAAALGQQREAEGRFRQTEDQAQQNRDALADVDAQIANLRQAALK